LKGKNARSNLCRPMKMQNPVNNAIRVRFCKIKLNKDKCTNGGRNDYMGLIDTKRGPIGT